MFWCDKCKIWEHEKCLFNAIKKEYLELKPTLTPTVENVRTLLRKINITIKVREDNGEVTAYVKNSDQKARQEISATDQQEQTNWNENEVKTVMPVKCLICTSCKEIKYN